MSAHDHPHRTDGADTARLRVRFHGRVQGVGYRATVLAAADAVARAGHPLTGWVRNELDGSVAMEAQGTPDAIETLLASIERARPGFASRVDRTPVPALGPGEETGFRVLPSV